MKFKRGDVVVSKNIGRSRVKDIVQFTPGDFDYDKYYYINANRGFVLQKHGWEFQDEWELYKKPFSRQVEAEYIRLRNEIKQ